MEQSRIPDGLRPTPAFENTERTHRGLRIIRITDKECFSPLADLKLPEDMRPECADCPAKSVSGELLEFLGGTIGGGTYIIRFHCGEHAKEHPFVTASALYPAWRVTERQSPGVYVCRKLSRPEQVARVRPERA